MRTSLRKCLTLAAVTATSVAIPAVASASTPEGLKWTHRPAPAYCEQVRGITINYPPAGYGTCYGGVWAHGVVPWWVIVDSYRRP